MEDLASNGTKLSSNLGKRNAAEEEGSRGTQEEREEKGGSAEKKAKVDMTEELGNDVSLLSPQTHPNVILLDKPIGWTPLQMIERYKAQKKLDKKDKIGYAGRLDPMARGLLIALTGEQVKSQKDFELMTKEYVFEVLVGVQTDTYDILGMTTPLACSSPENFSTSEIFQKIREMLPKFTGKHNQKYPPYSAARVNGRPLFHWAREGKLGDIVIPSVEVEIRSLQLLDTSVLELQQISQTITTRINSISSGDFRQKEILDNWAIVLRDLEQRNVTTLPIAKIVANVTSGTYIRSIANRIGEQLGTGAIAFDIYRTKVGKYCIEDAHRFQ
jgi:tRNA pseudouridine55 synthase